MMGAACILMLMMACTKPSPPLAQPELGEPNHWIVLRHDQESRLSWPPNAARSLPIPAVQRLGIDLTRLSMPEGATLRLGFEVRLPIRPGVKKYVLDPSSGFRGLEPYESALLSVTGPGNRVAFRTRVRALPPDRYEAFLEGSEEGP